MTIVIVVILVTVLLVYLIAKNQKDRKDIIDTENKNSVEETKTDQLRNTDKT
jgi:cell division protein FtsL